MVLSVHNEKRLTVLYGRVSAKGNSLFFLGKSGLRISDFIMAYQTLLYAMCKYEEQYVGMKDCVKRFEWVLEEAAKHSNEEERRRLLLEAEDVCCRSTAYSRHPSAHARTASALML